MAFSQARESKEAVRSTKRAPSPTSIHQAYLDSAEVYKRTDIEKSIDFITHSITELGKRPDKKALAESLAALGDVYQYHNQYDLAITNYTDANEAHRSSRTIIKLGKAHILNKEFDKAESVLTPLVQIDNLIPFQRVELFENLGDAYSGLGQVDRAVAFYEEGLKTAPQVLSHECQRGRQISKGKRRQRCSLERQGITGIRFKEKRIFGLFLAEIQYLAGKI